MTQTNDSVTTICPPTTEASAQENPLLERVMESLLTELNC